MLMRASEFDAVADDFDRFRAWPDGVAESIRTAMWQALGGVAGRCVLDLGAGTGRVGGAFITAGDAYIGVDASARMLARFSEKVASRGGPIPALVQADGRALPLPSAAFDAVLLVQVLSGAPGWRGILSEARRVLRRGGGLVLGKAIGPPGGVDARMRDRLALILADLGVERHRRGTGRDDALAWLAAAAHRVSSVVAARWESTRSPRDFLARHGTGARFASLPQPLKEEALGRLAEWAVAAFGALDTPLLEQHAFSMDIGFF
jgi:SAM-dependent methyltransferase